MRKATILAITVTAMLAASHAFSVDKEGNAAATASAKDAPGWIERGFARLERAIERLKPKLSGRERGAMMDGCQDMMGGGGMMGGGMMGGDRPNEGWRAPSERR